jgi:sugar O-acyltransferase (sialic acid O-acetyltransferase NeuD family)
MAVRRLLVLGANNPETVRVVQAVNDREPTFELVGFLDNDPAKQGRDFWGYPVLGGSAAVAEARYRDCVVVNAITRDTRTRCETTQELLAHGARLANLIHPSVDTRHVEMGVGIVVHEGAVIQPGVRIGDNCAFNCNTIVSHECEIEDHVFMAPGAVLAGLVRVRCGAMIGVHATVLPRLEIGTWALVGGGAVVCRDVPAHATVAGNPARVLPPMGGKRR